MNYIGCDCHISTLDCAVVNERGQETKKQKMHTGVKGLIEFVKSIPKPRKIIIEEGTLASWHSWPEVDTSKRSIIQLVTGEDSENLLCHITIRSRVRAGSKIN